LTSSTTSSARRVPELNAGGPVRKRRYRGTYNHSSGLVTGSMTRDSIVTRAFPPLFRHPPCFHYFNMQNVEWNQFGIKIRVRVKVGVRVMLVLASFFTLKSWLPLKGGCPAPTASPSNSVKLSTYDGARLRHYRPACPWRDRQKQDGH